MNRGDHVSDHTRTIHVGLHLRSPSLRSHDHSEKDGCLEKGGDAWFPREIKHVRTIAAYLKNLLWQPHGLRQVLV
ncbi:hypothetical protein OPV22_003257 [Ensete ventricosum]|uniref:Uncharacterized protein n=1 Tax=Ensete ventricosum TaxID=4639 RepID=A0AAV8S024_ENSVE|nr:hypothetical protein OPV22_003257 [Ensete ventricosum]